MLRRQIALWSLLGGATKLHAACLSRSNTLRLPLTYVLALNLSDIRQELQHQVRDKGTGDIVGPVARIEQGHVNHHDMRTLLLCYMPPLTDDLVVVAAKPVDGRYHQHILFAKAPHKATPLWPIEVFSTCLVAENLALFQPKSNKCIKLSAQILIP